MTITLTLPASEDDKARILRITALMMRMPMGKAIMEQAADLRRNGVSELTISFNRQMGDTYGLCQRSGSVCAISLSPHVSDAALAGVLLHEMRHAYQPVYFPDAYGEDMARLGVARMRLKEGDAFTHHFCAILDSPDASVRNEGFAMIAGKLPPEMQELYHEQAQAWTAAQTTAQKQAVMHDVFWLLQATRFGKYDTDLINQIRVMQEGNTLRPMKQSAFEGTLHLAVDIELLPGLLPDSRDSAYLGDDHTKTAQTLLRVAQTAEMHFDRLSVIEYDDTLPYSKPSGNDSLKFGR